MAKSVAKSGTYENPRTTLTRKDIRAIYDNGQVLSPRKVRYQDFVCCHVCKGVWWGGLNGMVADDKDSHVTLGQGPMVKGMHFLEVDSVYYLIPGHHVPCVELFNLNPLGYTYGH